MNYLLPPLTGGFWPVMVSVGSSPIRRRRSAPTPSCALPHQSMDVSPIMKVGEIVEWVDNLASLAWSGSGCFYSLAIRAMARFLSKERPDRGTLPSSCRMVLPRNIHLFPFSLHLRPRDRRFTVHSGTACGSTQSKRVPNNEGRHREKRGEAYGNTNGKRRRATGYRGR